MVTLINKKVLETIIALAEDWKNDSFWTDRNGTSMRFANVSFIDDKRTEIGFSYKDIDFVVDVKSGSLEKFTVNEPHFDYVKNVNAIMHIIMNLTDEELEIH